MKLVIRVHQHCQRQIVLGLRSGFKFLWPVFGKFSAHIVESGPRFLCKHLFTSIDFYPIP